MEDNPHFKQTTVVSSICSVPSSSSLPYMPSTSKLTKTTDISRRWN